MSPAIAPVFRMHPRGFMGGYPPPVIERAPKMIDSINFDHQYRLNIVRPADPATYPNQTITELYQKQISGGLEPTTLAFRNKVLVAALAAFGTMKFDQWYLQQLRSPAYGDTHSRFLDDTLNFISGQAREMHPMTWAGIVAMDTNTAIPAPYSKVADKFFDLKSILQGSNTCIRKDRTELVDVIQSWCSRPKGFEDMLCTLNVLFGSY